MYKIDFNNKIHVHFIGIGGISMSGLAEILLGAGFTISGSDREEAIKTGEIAVKSALNGKTGMMIVFKRVSNNPYKIEFSLEDLSKVANAVSLIPQSMMKDATRMDESFRQYIRPLINGEVQLKCKDGIALVTNFKRVHVK